MPNRCIGSIGCAVRNSHHTNAARLVSPAPSDVATAGCERPSRCISINANTVAANPAAASTAPGRSTCEPLACGSSVVRPVDSTNVATTGTADRMKIHRQFKKSTANPPSSGPNTNAVPVQAVQTPTALG